MDYLPPVDNVRHLTWIEPMTSSSRAFWWPAGRSRYGGWSHGAQLQLPVGFAFVRRYSAFFEQARMALAAPSVRHAIRK